MFFPQKNEDIGAPHLPPPPIGVAAFLGLGTPAPGRWGLAVQWRFASPSFPSMQSPIFDFACRGWIPDPLQATHPGSHTNLAPVKLASGLNLWSLPPIF